MTRKILAAVLLCGVEATSARLGMARCSRMNIIARYAHFDFANTCHYASDAVFYPIPMLNKARAHNEDTQLSFRCIFIESIYIPLDWQPDGRSPHIIYKNQQFGFQRPDSFECFLTGLRVFACIKPGSPDDCVAEDRRCASSKGGDFTFRFDDPCQRRLQTVEFWRQSDLGEYHVKACKTFFDCKMFRVVFSFGREQHFAFSKEHLHSGEIGGGFGHSPGNTGRKEGHQSAKYTSCKADPGIAEVSQPKGKAHGHQCSNSTGAGPDGNVREPAHLPTLSSQCALVERAAA